MKHELSVKDRLVLLNILPEQSSLATLRIVRELREELSFSEDEHKATQMRNLDDGRLMWEEGMVPDKGIEIGPKAANVIRDALAKLDEGDELTMDHLDLCDEFEYTGD